MRLALILRKRCRDLADVGRREFNAVPLQRIGQKTERLLLHRAFPRVGIGRLVVVGLLVLLRRGHWRQGARRPTLKAPLADMPSLAATRELLMLEVLQDLPDLPTQVQDEVFSGLPGMLCAEVNARYHAGSAALAI